MIRLALLLSLVPHADAPLVGRPNEHFYGAVGERVRIELRVATQELRVEEPFVLTMVVHGADNPGGVYQPDLEKLPEFSSRFHVEKLPGDGPPRSPRIFRYRLRPKTEQVRDVPPLLFHYYNPRLNYFATTAPTDPIALTLSPRTSSSQGMPLNEPEFLFDQASDDELSDRPMSSQTAVLYLLMALLLPPLAFELLYLAWRMRNPNAVKLAALRRSQAVRRALDALAKEPAPQVIARTVLEYLRGRMGLALWASTPTEIVTDLARRKLSSELIARTDSFFRACDAARFAPPMASATPLALDAEKLILDVERHA